MGVVIIVIMRVCKTEAFNAPIISMSQSLALSLGITGHQGLITCCSLLVIISSSSCQSSVPALLGGVVQYLHRVLSVEVLVWTVFILCTVTGYSRCQVPG